MLYIGLATSGWTRYCSPNSKYWRGFSSPWTLLLKLDIHASCQIDDRAHLPWQLPWLKYAVSSIYWQPGVPKYNAILKIIIWCNGIGWHNLMFKNTLFFKYCTLLQFLYAPPLSNTSFSTKSLLLTSTVCSDWPADTVHCDWPNTTSTLRKCNVPFHNRELQLSK